MSRRCEDAKAKNRTVVVTPIFRRGAREGTFQAKRGGTTVSAVLLYCLQYTMFQAPLDLYLYVLVCTALANELLCALLQSTSNGCTAVCSAASRGRSHVTTPLLVV